MGKPRIVSTLLIGFILIAVFLPSCEKYDRHISEILDRLDKIEGTSLATIDQQITAINASLEDLTTVDAALEKLIDDLEAETADLQQQLDDNATADAATKKALEDEIAAIKLLILPCRQRMRSWSSDTSIWSSISTTRLPTPKSGQISLSPPCSNMMRCRPR